MADNKQTGASAGKQQSKETNGQAAPAQFALYYGGAPLPPAAPRVTPLTRRAVAPSAAASASPPAPPAAAPAPTSKAAGEAKPVSPAGGAVVAGATDASAANAAGARPNPLTARRALPTVAVISAATAPPKVAPDSVPDAALAAAAAAPAEWAAPASIAPTELPANPAETTEPTSAAMPSTMASTMPATMPATAAGSLVTPAAPNASAAASGFPVGVVPGAALAFLSAEQRAKVREQAPIVLPPAPLPPAAAAMAAMARKGKGPVLMPAKPLPDAAAPDAAAPVAAVSAESSLEQSPEPIVEPVAEPVAPLAEPVAEPASTLVAAAAAADEPTPLQAVAVAGAAVAAGQAARTPLLPAPLNGAKAVVSVRGITKVYTMGDVEVRALQGVDLDILQGEMTAIMGPSGSGKSTLMNIIGCLDVPSDGVYLLDGEDVSRMQDDELAEVRSRKIGFVFQSFNLLSRTSALANVELPLLYSGIGTRARHKRSQQVLDLVGLGSRMHHKPNELSGGQQQRVAIARALINEPAMILADEPTGNLDSKTSVEIMELFQRLNQERGITIVFVTHNIETADYCHRVVHIRDGHVERDVRHQPRAGIYRDLLPEDLPLESLRAPVADGTPVAAPLASPAPASISGEAAAPQPVAQLPEAPAPAAQPALVAATPSSEVSA